jgi:hypothetical protein
MPELGFKNVKIAEKFIDKIKVLWYGWISNEDRFEMQVIAEIVKLMVENNVIVEEDLYKLGEEEVLLKAKECGISKIKNAVINFENMTEVYTSDVLPKKIYSTKIKGKRRYINPLVRIDDRVCRLAEVSRKTQENISKFLETDMSKYLYSNFEI